MNLTKLTCITLAFTAATFGGGAKAEPPSSAPQASAQPVFLLSERELGSGIKVCFLSNGLQMRLPSEKVCPYPLKAPPLTLEQQAAASTVTSANTPASNAEIAQPTLPEAPKVAGRAEAQAKRTPADAASSAVKLAEPMPKKAPAQPMVSQPLAQPVVTPHDSSASNKTEVIAEGAKIERPEAIQDEIADKAIRRCERIGFKPGTEPFKLCALDQIKILSGFKP